MTPVWALSLAYWLHMLATVVWIGSLSVLSIFVLPVARQSMQGGAYADFIHRIQKRLDPVGWFSLIVLLATGMFQMSANANYQGFLAINSQWAVAILVKHILFVLVIGISAYSTWGVMPKLRRLALLQSRSTNHSLVDEKVVGQEMILLRLNLVVAVLVLALTAFARAVS